MAKNKSIKMVDLNGQYLRIKDDINQAFQAVMMESQFIQGRQVKEFEANLAKYLGVNHVIACGNGTDALQIALMALNLPENSEIIIPVHTYVSTAEVIALLKLKPRFVDVDPEYFTLDISSLKAAINANTSCIVPVHLYGQVADMAQILEIAGEKIKIIEDNAQAMGASYFFSNGMEKKAGTIGTIGTMSFFPTKTLGCYGDGGGIAVNDHNLATQSRMIANHGQSSKYVHDIIGVNSRLDTLQAAFLDIKLKYLDEYNEKRNLVAEFYSEALKEIDEVETPKRAPYSSHVYHQYTLKIKNGKRDELKDFLAKKGIPAIIYYPIPLHNQKAYLEYARGEEFPVSEMLAESVLSLPMHTELNEEQAMFICSTIRNFYNK